MYYQLICQIQSKDIELISSFFFEHDCLGIEIIERDEAHTDFLGEIYRLNDEDYPKEGSRLIGYFEKIVFIDQFKQFIKNKEIQLIDEIKIEYLEDKNYQEAYLESFQEINITEQLSIVPSWFKDYQANKKYVLIEPGMGFGTGEHPTTRLSIKALIQYLKKDDCVLDIGTGSGVLAIISKLYGAKKTIALDLDSDALKNARKNAALNKVYDIIFLNQDVSQLQMTFDLIIANVVCKTLIEILPEVRMCLRIDGIFILSGLLKNELDLIIEALEGYQFKLHEMIVEEEWLTLITTKIG